MNNPASGYHRTLFAALALLCLAVSSLRATPTPQYINILTSASLGSSGSTQTVNFSINDSGTVSSSESYTDTSGFSSGVTYNVSNIVASYGYVSWVVRQDNVVYANAGLSTYLYKVKVARYLRTTRTWEVIAIATYDGGGAYTTAPWYYQIYSFSNTVSYISWSTNKVPYSGSNTYGGGSYSIPMQNPAPVFTTQPVSTTAKIGDTKTFTAAATGATSWQWLKNHTVISGKTSSSLTLTNIQVSDAGSYSVQATNQGGSTDESNAATLTVDNNAPIATISVDGQSNGAILTHNYGSSVTITVRYGATDAEGNLSGIRYNIWNPSTGYFDNGGGFVSQSGGSGEVAKTFTLSDDGDWYFWTDAQDSTSAYSSTGAWDAGFKITVVQNGQPVTSTDTTGLLVNLSSRGYVGTGYQTMIMGFVLSGSGSKPLLINGRGPSMVPAGVSTAITDPYITLYNSSASVIGSNDDWGSAANATDISNTGYGPSSTYPKEASILSSLSSGLYSAFINNYGTGNIGLFELNDYTSAASPKLVNMSTRAYTGTGDNVLICGFVIVGGPKRVLIVGKGPSFSGALTGELTNPVLTLYHGPTAIQSNDNWGTAWNYADIDATPYKPTNAYESALYEVLPAGVYSVMLTGVSSGTGIGSIEIYDL